MSPNFVIETERTGLRAFQPEDLDAFAELNADSTVMEFFPKHLSRDESSYFIERINQNIADDGFGFWAAENLESNELMGMIGITRVRYQTDFTPAVEIGWRLAKPFWGKGLATEGANAALRFGFETAKLEEVVSFTSVINTRSESVMKRLGMKKTGEFEHPKVPDGHRLKTHALYRLTENEWRNHIQDG